MPDPTPQAHSELASFGEELRREREIRGISLKEIADATKISKRFLEAIERNDHKTLPAPVFTRGFVREYARYLGLNFEEIVNRYNFAAAGDDRIEKTPHLERLAHPEVPPPAPKALPKRDIPPVYARVDRNVLLTVFIIAALVGVSWWAIKNKRASAEVREAAPPPITFTQAAAPMPAPTVTETAAEPDGHTLRLTMEMIGDSWVRLEADGKTVVNDELKRGDRRAFTAQDRFNIRTIGNAAGVILTLNDTRLPLLGDEGEVVRNRVLDHETLVTATQNTEGSGREQ
jgi:transcriptional regulator with XRE-family HTH domain